MPFKDILLQLDNYPDAMAPEMVDRAVQLCKLLGERVCAVTLHAHFPLHSNRVADFLVGLSELARDEERRSVSQAQTLLARFRAEAATAGVVATELMLRSELYNAADAVAAAARTRDVCVVPLTDRSDAQRGVAEAAIFGSGRPVVVFRSDDARGVPDRLRRILICWDGGRAAARAVADAMPILGGAGDVQILTVVNEKASADTGAGEDLQRHLGLHGVVASLEEVDATGASIGAVLRRHLAQDPRDLVVMGAFGHSRAREFILGGATKSLLDSPPAPVFFSH